MSGAPVVSGTSATATASGVSTATGSPGTVAAGRRIFLPSPFGDIHARIWQAGGAGPVAGEAAGGELAGENPAGASRHPCVVLVHGMFGDVDVWSAMALNLARAGLQVLAFDLPGHGRSTAQVENADETAQALETALQAYAEASAQHPVPVLLVGHSFGGLVAAMLAERLCRSSAAQGVNVAGAGNAADVANAADIANVAGADVFPASGYSGKAPPGGAGPVCGVRDGAVSLTGLVVLSTSGLGEEVNRDFLLGVIEAPDADAMARVLAALTVRHFRSSSAYMKAMHARIHSAKDQLYRLVDDVVDGTGRQVHSILEILAALPVPVTLVHGREDAVLPWQQALNVPGSVAIHLLPDVGHMPHWEAAALVSTIIGRAAGRG
mgnify:FL=1